MLSSPRNYVCVCACASAVSDGFHLSPKKKEPKTERSRRNEWMIASRVSQQSSCDMWLRGPILCSAYGIVIYCRTRIHNSTRTMATATRKTTRCNYVYGNLSAHYAKEPCTPPFPKWNSTQNQKKNAKRKSLGNRATVFPRYSIQFNSMFMSFPLQLDASCKWDVSPNTKHRKYFARCVNRWSVWTAHFTRFSRSLMPYIFIESDERDIANTLSIYCLFIDLWPFVAESLPCMRMI